VEYEAASKSSVRVKKNKSVASSQSVPAVSDSVLCCVLCWDIV